MKIIALNGSPRKNWNTATLLQKALEGAVSQGAETELIHLYDYQYKGCTSCFACKRKSKITGKCAMEDKLTPVLEKVRNADALIFGTPIYFMGITSGMAAFLERFYFPLTIYSAEIPTVLPKKIPSGFIYTMNAKEGPMGAFKAHLNPFESYFTESLLGEKAEILYSYNTYQFTNYDQYESSVFSEPEKAKQKAEQFPIDCENAFQMGVRLAQMKK